MSVATQPFTGTFVADPVHSSVEFTVRHMKVSLFRAWFDDVDARLVADEHGIRLGGAARVESVSIRSPREFREHVVHGAEFFDAGNHPEITVRSEGIHLGEDGTATGHGELTIRGITRPVTATGTYRAPVEDPYGSLRGALELTATVDRRDWGMDWQAPLPAGGDALGHEVQLSVHLELVKEA
ncbi:MAG: YceI family protein [Nocardioidaceae bacterium]|nr:YceI family protein [Nocardioidaceae bacterium]